MTIYGYVDDKEMHLRIFEKKSQYFLLVIKSKNRGWLLEYFKRR